MSEKLGLWVDDPRSVEGANALSQIEPVEAQKQPDTKEDQTKVPWYEDPYIDPRGAIARLEVQRRRTLEAYVNDGAGWWGLSKS